MRFRTTLLFSMVLLIAAIVAAMAIGTSVIFQRAARGDVATGLRETRDVFKKIYDYRKSVHRFGSRVIAEEPRLKAVVATEDVSRETVVSVVDDLHKEIESDVFLVVDRGGDLLYDAADPTAVGAPMRDEPLIKGALEAGEKAGILTRKGKAYQATALRLSFGDEVFGVLILGYVVDESIANLVQELTGGAIVIELDGAMIAASSQSGVTDRARLTSILASVPTAADAPPTEVSIEGARYMAIAAPLDAAGDRTQVRYVALRSLDEALEPTRAAAKVVYGIAAAALAAAVFLALLLSNRLSRPLDRLAGFMGVVAAGDLAQKAPIEGPVEVRALGSAMDRMIGELAQSRQDMAAKERLEKELEIGARIQTCLLPQTFAVDGLEIAATMIPASEVGGDYYDVFPVSGGAFIGIGDVAGHGLTAGLIMLMAQSTVAAIGRKSPDAAPREILSAVNDVLVDNIRSRLHHDEHVTLTLFRYHRDGRFVFAGAHEEIIVCRAATGRCELIPTPGPWLGARRDLRAVLTDSELTLNDGDLMVLYTDGITEAQSASKEMFELERVTAIVERDRERPVEAIRDAIMSAVVAWTATQSDDISLIVLRYRAA